MCSFPQRLAAIIGSIILLVGLLAFSAFAAGGNSSEKKRRLRRGARPHNMHRKILVAPVTLLYIFTGADITAHGGDIPRLYGPDGSCHSSTPTHDPWDRRRRLWIVLHHERTCRAYDRSCHKLAP